jgi:hypothetical protein
MIIHPEFKECVAILRADDVDLPAVAAFLESVYVYGLYAEPKDYKKAMKPYLKSLDAKIIELSLYCANVPTDPFRRIRVFEVAKVRNQIDGHFWRAERICEIMDKKRAT